MRNREMPIDTNDFFRKKVEFKKEGDGLVVVEKPNNGEQIVRQEAQEIEPIDRLKILREKFKKEIKTDESGSKAEKRSKQDGVFVNMDDEAETVIKPAEVVQPEIVKTDIKEEKAVQEEKPEVVFDIEDRINELKKKRIDKEEIIANYEKVFNESRDERIKERTADKIQKMNEEIAKVDAEIRKQNINQGGVDLAYFNDIRDQIAEFEERGQNIRTGKKIDSEGKEIILTEEERKKLVDLQKEQHEEYLKNKQELEEIFKAVETDETKQYN